MGHLGGRDGGRDDSDTDKSLKKIDKELKQTKSKLQEREGDIVGWSIKKWVVQPKQSIQQAIPYLRPTQRSIGAADPVSPTSPRVIPSALPHDEEAAVTRAITD